MSAQSPSHKKNASNTVNSTPSSLPISINDLASEHIIIHENENMDLDGALHNSLL